MSETAKLTIGDQTVELPLICGTEGDRAIDITQLRDKTGLITYDPSTRIARPRQVYMGPLQKDYAPWENR